MAVKHLIKSNSFFNRIEKKYRIKRLKPPKKLFITKNYFKLTSKLSNVAEEKKKSCSPT